MSIASKIYLCKLATANLRTDNSAAGNRRLAQRRVMWFIEYSISYQVLSYIDSFVLRNP